MTTRACCGRSNIFSNPRITPCGCSASGKELLDSGCLPTIDCLISDIDVPGMEGFELLRQVHAARPGLPIILITGYPDTLKRLPGLGGNSPRFFTKPFQGPELLAAISEALSRASTTRS